MNKAISKIGKLVIVLAVSIAMALTPICAYAAPAQQTVTIDAVAVNNAITNKDYNYIISIFFKYYGNYFRQHHQEANFQYFNATEYMKKYPDVAAACNNDPNKALEHYIAHGASEGRSGCGKYDIVKFLKKYPETVLSAEFTNNVNTPEKYFEAVQPKIESANSSGSGELSGGGGGGGKGGYTPTPTPEVEKSFTMMFYLSGTDLEDDPAGEMTRGIVDAIFGAYGSDNVNVLFTLGGTNAWTNPYCQNILANTDEGFNRAGIFELDVEKANAILDEIVSEMPGMTVAQLYSVISNYTYGQKTYEAVRDKLLGSTDETSVLIPKQILTRGADDPTLMSQSDTLYKTLRLATTEYAADNYALIFGSHGGGCLSGVCYSDDDNGTGMLTTIDLETAFSNAGFGSKDYQNNLAFLGFDACLMGSAEIATKLDDYYTFMYGSEAVTAGDLGYCSLLQTIADNKNKDDIANIIAYQAFDNRYNAKGGAGSIATSALFYGEYADEALTSMNKWPQALRESIRSEKEYQEADETAVYTAIKRALVRSYQMSGGTSRDNGNYFDAADFLAKLKIALEQTGHITATQNQNVAEEIDNTIELLDKMVAANLFNFNDQYIYKHEDGQDPVIQNEELMRKYINYNFCGATFMIPGYDFTTVNYDMSDIEKQKDDALTRLKKEYTDKYGTGLGNYSALLKDYVTYMVSAREASRVKQLIKEMTNQMNWNPLDEMASPSEGSYGSNKVTGYDDLVAVTLDDNNSVIRIIVSDYKDSDVKSSHSSGDAFVDLIDTTTEFKTYLTRKVNMLLKEDKEGKTTTSYMVDIIIAQDNISYSKLNSANANETTTNEIDVFTKSFLYTSYNYLIYDGTDHKYDALIPSELDVYGDKTNIMDLFDESKGGSFGDYVLYLAEGYNADDASLGEMQLLFKKNGDGENRATFVGAARYDSEIGAYVKGTGVKTIAFAHYTAVEGVGSQIIDEYQGIDYIKSVNTSGSASYFNTDNITLKATDGTTVLGSKYDVSKLVVMTQELQYADSEIMHNGFFIVAKNGDDCQICFNDNQQKEVNTNPKTIPEGGTAAAEVNIFMAVNEETQYSSLISTTETVPSTSVVDSPKRIGATELAETITEEVSITAEPEITPVQAVLEEKVTAEESSETLENAA